MAVDVVVKVCRLEQLGLEEVVSAKMDVKSRNERRLDDVRRELTSIHQDRTQNVGANAAREGGGAFFPDHLMIMSEHEQIAGIIRRTLKSASKQFL